MEITKDFIRDVLYLKTVYGEKDVETIHKWIYAVNHDLALFYGKERYDNNAMKFRDAVIDLSTKWAKKYHADDVRTVAKYYELLKDVLVTYDVPFVVIHYPEQLHELSIKLGIAPQKVVSWIYNSNTAKQHRDVAFYKVKPNFNLIKQPYKNPNDKRIKERIAKGIEGGRLYDWWNINQVKNVSKKELNHPCVMPIEVMKNIIGILPERYTIFDPFMGTGTTGVACKELGIDFIGCEIEKDYYDIAERRIEELGL